MGKGIKKREGKGRKREKWWEKEEKLKQSICKYGKKEELKGGWWNGGKLRYIRNRYKFPITYVIFMCTKMYQET